MHSSLDHKTHRADVCVVGGGMAGLIAAVSAARRGSRVILVHDRPVLGGNASSEVRMWICGAQGTCRKETGILEEIKLLNRFRNPQGLYAVWDSVLFEFALMTPGLTTLLNCTCNNGRMEDGYLQSIDAWQLTTQTWHTVEAKIYIDCSGDSILGRLSGAEMRHGRESREEFQESIAPSRSDLKTMGNSILMQLEETNRPQTFRPPEWAHTFDESSTLPSRVGNGFGQNFWWIELGGLQNTISDAEEIRDQLLRTTWGIWDYMKNRGPQAEKLTNWRMRWMGALPGKRENLRFLGPHILTQNDLTDLVPFDDLVAYGGWSMDDHHPAGLLYPGKATIFHKAASPYGIPLRSLYSRNVPNLFCAGRNISATHSALSSTRVMGTCSVIGQAVGTAAALCTEKSTIPSRFTTAEVSELQRRLMEDDCWLPGQTKPLADATRTAKLQASNGENLEALRDGHERNADSLEHAWQGAPGASVTFSWDSPRQLECLRLVFDSNLNEPKLMSCQYTLDDKDKTLPSELVKNYRIEIQTSGNTWETLIDVEENRRRMHVLSLQREAKAVRFTGNEAWGGGAIRVFSMEASENPIPLTLSPAHGQSWTELVSSLPGEDLAPPDSGLEEDSPGTGRVGA